MRSTVASSRSRWGPITAQYKGAAVFVERNHDDWKVVIKGDGRDTRGAGNASALITATLHPVSDEVTKIDVHTDLTITGKVAQFGRGAIADVSTKLMGQFAENLEALLDETPSADATPTTQRRRTHRHRCPWPVATGDTGVAAAASAAATSTIRKIDSPEPEAVDLLDVAGTPLAQAHRVACRDHPVAVDPASHPVEQRLIPTPRVVESRRRPRRRSARYDTIRGR